MADDNEEISIFDMADRFIEVANRLVSEDKQDVGRVGAALRYAAARFNAHEASLKSDNLGEDKDDALEWFTDQYHKMLLENLEEHIELSEKSVGDGL
ncbi:DUF3144 domain-containing protein [Grimontia marina]|uniref:DUF3144 domain-containing protein n=1 Tax=Grimontia marina TaxID=646534 RepID=A0A128FLF3_9GAMM|nr:DUF3144 domain-containing protein [Grimontia marina]CZF87104.1 hypothetical protein GMA8713_05150 [Grimontia marina]